MVQVGDVLVSGADRPVVLKRGTGGRLDVPLASMAKSGDRQPG